MKVPAEQKTRGQWVELLFMARAAREGLKVAKPHGDARYDVIVESRTGLHRVQVKSTLFKRRGCYECLCFWSRVRANREAKRYRPAQVDFVAAYIVPENSWFIIPVAEIGTTTLYLPPKERAARSKYGKYREAWKLLGAVNGGLTIQACAEEAASSQFSVLGFQCALRPAACAPAFGREECLPSGPESARLEVVP